MCLRLAGPLVALHLALLALVTGCNDQGHSGEACEADASALYPTYTCNAGLVCNTGEPTPTCQAPNEQGADGPCGDDFNCKSGLYCAVSRTCEAQLSAGEACPDETGCGPGLVCANVPTPTCVASDAAALAQLDATVGSDGGADASVTDAAGCLGVCIDAGVELIEASAVSDAACGDSESCPDSP
jgi:hypothetical protein